MGKRLREFYYITHIENLPSILQRGILSHARVEAENLSYTPVYDAGIVQWRKGKRTPDGLSLWDYANLYFQPRNPMLYRLVMEGRLGTIAVLGVQKEVLKIKGAMITTGNAARSETQILPREAWTKYRDEILQGIAVEWWSEADGSKRRIMAEVLVPEAIPPELITTIYVPDNRSLKAVRELLQQTVPTALQRIHIIPEPHMFFQPRRVRPITRWLKLVEGDMFFSRLQTLTISVNTVGVMGKGLASRAKYQFPDAYVVYQDACRKGWLQPGKPYLYKRESSLDLALADEPYTLANANRRTWFLFFPTKRHWREKSRLEDIDSGLNWIVSHYAEEGITSLAVPALGCGLGGLSWASVGPLMVQRLAPLEIEVHLHLPLEQPLPEEQLSRDFLLGEHA